MERRVKPLHDRMPIILPEHNYDSWLKPDAEGPPIDLLRPYDAEKDDGMESRQSGRQREER
jgi:putative SOS response-associated peptidase YedK